MVFNLLPAFDVQKQDFIHVVQWAWSLAYYWQQLRNSADTNIDIVSIDMIILVQCVPPFSNFFLHQAVLKMILNFA